MKIDRQEMQAVSTNRPSPRVDIYTGIHKALRALMVDTLLALGRVDPDDKAELVAVGDRVSDLLDFCVSHVGHENAFIHIAMEARAPGASDAVTHEHEEHLAHIARLKSAVASLCGTTANASATTAVLDLYRSMALFVAQNFEHMHIEETAHNAVLWAHYTDAELIAIHDALVASIPPAEMMHTIRWLVPSMNPGERTAMLGDMLAHAPAPAFSAALDTVRPHLTETEWAKLTRSLGLPPVPGLIHA